MSMWNFFLPWTLNPPLSFPLCIFTLSSSQLPLCWNAAVTIETPGHSVWLYRLALSQQKERRGRCEGSVRDELLRQKEDNFIEKKKKKTHVRLERECVVVLQFYHCCSSEMWKSRTLSIKTHIHFQKLLSQLNFQNLRSFILVYANTHTHTQKQLFVGICQWQISVRNDPPQHWDQETQRWEEREKRNLCCVWSVDI